MEDRAKETTSRIRKKTDSRYRGQFSFVPFFMMRNSRVWLSHRCNPFAGRSNFQRKLGGGGDWKSFLFLVFFFSNLTPPDSQQPAWQAFPIELLRDSQVFLLSSQLSRRTRAETLAMQARLLVNLKLACFSFQG